MARDHEPASPCPTTVIVLGADTHGLRRIVLWLGRFGAHIGDTHPTDEAHPRYPWKDAVWSTFHEALLGTPRGANVDSSAAFSEAARRKIIDLIARIGEAKRARANEDGSRWWVLPDISTPEFLDLHQELFADARFVVSDRPLEECAQDLQAEFPGISHSDALHVAERYRARIARLVKNRPSDVFTVSDGQSDGPEASAEADLDTAWNLGVWLGEPLGLASTNAAPARVKVIRSDSAGDREARIPTDLIDRPIFIVGHIRSGATLLYQTLMESETLWSWRVEGHNIWEHFPELRPGSHGNRSHALAASDATSPIKRFLREAAVTFGLNRDSEPYPTVYQHFAGQAYRFLNKNPYSALRVPFLDAVFPDALFIHLVRDGLANVSSAVEAWSEGLRGIEIETPFPPGFHLANYDGTTWKATLVPGWRRLSGKSLEEACAFQYARANEIALDDLDRLNDASRVYRVHFEELVDNPHEVLSRICEFVGIDFDDSLRRRTEAGLPPSDAVISDPSPEKWKLRFDSQALKRITPMIAEVTERLGY